MPIQLMVPKGTGAEVAAEWGCSDFQIVEIAPRDEEYKRLAEKNELVRFAFGRVVSDRERNQYHDSDFFVTYQTDAGGYPERQYGTTRGWAYLNTATIDATPEVKAHHVEFEKRVQELSRKLREEREAEERAELAVEVGLTAEQVLKIQNCYPNLDVQDAIWRLLRTKKFRSDFRQKLAQTIRVWVADENPKYPKPLSAKQIQYI